MSSKQRLLVSAVIPAYNAEHFIADAIESVLYQSYRHIECIVVDDGSTDRTGEICRRYGDNIRYIRTENRGVSVARNLGSATAATLLAFLNADDIWLPRKIEYQVALFETDPAIGMVYTGYHVVDEHLNFRARFAAPPPYLALRNTLLLERPSVSVAQTGLVSAAAFDAVHGFDPGLSTSADCDLACKIASRYKVAAVDRPLVLYRRHSEQMHHDPVATERDMTRVYDKLFSSEWVPPEILRLRRRARANLHVSLAGSYLIAGNRSAFLKHALRAFVTRPDRVLHAIGRLTSPQGDMKRAH